MFWFRKKPSVPRKMRVDKVHLGDVIEAHGRTITVERKRTLKNGDVAMTGTPMRYADTKWWQHNTKAIIVGRNDKVIFHGLDMTWPDDGMWP